MTTPTPYLSGTAGGASRRERQAQQMESLLKKFADETPDVAAAVLVSRDGLRLMDSGVEKDWADPLAAAISSMYALAGNVPSPTGERSPAQLVFIERADGMLLLQAAGSSSFQGGSLGGALQDTVLCVLAGPRADVGTTTHEMQRLVTRFGAYMDVPVRAATNADAS
ncbi:roadblock/LC7 domain-containing protein [Streptomyces sp. NPDC056160]|uniref:roadblock/LC7 domain-containing protein n=1 Tax=Streptomyces sp. NPDC056160 TaxID=3345731 RepID=UPI0035D69C7F